MWRVGVVVLTMATLAISASAFAATGQQISVNGTGGASVPAGASTAEQQTAYDQALTAAIGDAQSKARMVAQQLVLTLGSVQSFTEQSDDYLGYCGVGFLPGAATNGVRGTANAPSTAAAPSGQLTPIPPKPRRHRSKKKAHKAQGENTCLVQADVTVVYLTG